jgi:hypothetical protein
MKDKPDQRQESLWRGALTDAQRTDIRSRPDLAEEARLTRALKRMTDTPVPSNFTTLVLEAVEREEIRAARPQRWHWNWHALWPRLAVATALVLFAGIGIHHHAANVQRTTLAKDLATVIAAAAPSLDALEDLEAIQRMSQASQADGELLAAMQ